MTDVFEEDCLEGDPWSTPTAELSQKITAQLEFYLSNENLAEDAFLLKHVQRNKLGYVSLKLLTSFKKVCCFSYKPRNYLICLLHFVYYFGT